MEPVLVGIGLFCGAIGVLAWRKQMWALYVGLVRTWTMSDRPCSHARTTRLASASLLTRIHERRCTTRRRRNLRSPARPRPSAQAAPVSALFFHAPLRTSTLKPKGRILLRRAAWLESPIRLELVIARRDVADRNRPKGASLGNIDCRLDPSREALRNPAQAADRRRMMSRGFPPSTVATSARGCVTGGEPPFGRSSRL